MLLLLFLRDCDGHYFVHYACWRKDNYRPAGLLEQLLIVTVFRTVLYRTVFFRSFSYFSGLFCLGLFCMGLYCTDMFLYRLEEFLCHSLEIVKQIIFLIFWITQLAFFLY